MNTRSVIIGALLAAVCLGSAAGRPASRDLSLEAAKHARPVASEVSLTEAGPMFASVMPTTPSVLPIGARLGFRMVSTADGYGHLYVLSASGKTRIWFENRRLRAGRPLGFPGGAFEVRATPPAGDDTVVFVVTRDRIDGFAAGRATAGPRILEISRDGFDAALEQKLRAFAPPDRASARAVVRVVDEPR